MEEMRSSETLVNARCTQRHIPEDDILHSHRCGNLKSCILNPVRKRKALDPIGELRVWDLFQSFASELTFSNIQMHPPNKADKAAHDLPTQAQL
jgi:hypothetical protein